MQEGGHASSSSSVPMDPKVKRKYANLVEMALQQEDDEPGIALELFKYVIYGLSCLFLDLFPYFYSHSLLYYPCAHGT